MCRWQEQEQEQEQEPPPRTVLPAVQRPVLRKEALRRSAQRPVALQPTVLRPVVLQPAVLRPRPQAPGRRLALNLLPPELEWIRPASFRRASMTPCLARPRWARPVGAGRGGSSEEEGVAWKDGGSRAVIRPTTPLRLPMASRGETFSQSVVPASLVLALVLGSRLRRPRGPDHLDVPCVAGDRPAARRCSTSGSSRQCRACRTIRESRRWRDRVLSLARRRGLWMPQVVLTLEGWRLIVNRTRPQRQREANI